jgi:hypothetical protein
LIEVHREKEIGQRRERLVLALGDLFEKTLEASGLAESLIDRLVEMDQVMLSEIVSAESSEGETSRYQ